MPRAATQSGRLSFLPPGAADGLKRLCRQLLGLSILTAAALLAAALLSYSSADPSFNTAVGGPAENWLGRPGAHIADLMLQGFGLGAGLIVLGLTAWSWPLIRGGYLARPLHKLALLSVAIGLAAIALAALTAPAAWPLRAGLGGAAGDLLLAGCLGLAAWLGAPWFGAGLFAMIAALAASLLLLPALALDLPAVNASIRAAAASIAQAGRWVVARLQRDDGERAEKRTRTRRTGERIEPVLAKSDVEPETGALEDQDFPPPPRFLVEPSKRRAKPSKRAEKERQKSLALEDTPEVYRLPELDLLDLPRRSAKRATVDQDALSQNAQLLESVLEDFGVRGEIVKIRPGPVVTLYEFVPAPGTKTSRVIGLSDDIARSMSAVSVRVAVIPGRNAIGIELPNSRREAVFLREILESTTYERSSARLPLVLGKDIGGAPIIVDLDRMPHLLIAGTTGSGKSVAINTMILSLLYRLKPEQCKFIMIDPKMLELSVYDGIPQLLAPVVTEPPKAVVALKWAVREMENRYQSMAKLGVRNIEGFNMRVAEARRRGEVLQRRVQTGFDPDTGRPTYEDQPLDMSPLPYIVLIVDEMADLMLVAGKDIEAAVQRLAQMARAAGIHLIMATQRPSVDVITGTIKANFPTRVSFQVTSKIDSRTILGEQGAETLLGQGDMLYMAGGGRITRVHGPFVSDAEVEEVVRYLKAQGSPSYIESITEDDEAGPLAGLTFGGAGEGEDALYQQAVELVLRERKASTSFVQRHLQIGYNRAARLIERMEADGLISAANHVGRREILAGNADD
ncbi:MAG: DNA translocase FtsK 4TM domain-containing protein [Alphaproteobacteria bacterium]|nr:DNA translocase FtsK 4TM domain-containing protein [Alphaproteobacteria bacterium]